MHRRTEYKQYNEFHINISMLIYLINFIFAINMVQIIRLSREKKMTKS